MTMLYPNLCYNEVCYIEQHGDCIFQISTYYPFKCIMVFIRPSKLYDSSLMEYSSSIEIANPNSADSDEMAYHQGLHCSSKYPFRGLQYRKGSLLLC